MSLSKDEHRAWNELERALADDFPSAPVRGEEDESWIMTLPPASLRILLPELTVVVGVIVLIAACVVQVLPLGLAGLVLTCIGVDHIRQRCSGMQDMQTNPPPGI